MNTECCPNCGFVLGPHQTALAGPLRIAHLALLALGALSEERLCDVLHETPDYVRRQMWWLHRQNRAVFLDGEWVPT